MSRDRKKIISALKKKGFVKGDKDHHDYYYFHHEGKISGVYTYFSTGSKYKVYGAPLLSQIKKQLKLNDNKELLNLIDCPMSEKDYINILKGKSYL